MTKTLVGTLGYINREKREVGIDFARDGGPIAEFICGKLVVVVEGSVIGNISPVNKLLKPPSHFVLQFVQKGGETEVHQTRRWTADVLQTSLNGGPFEQPGLSSTDLIMFVAPVEIKA